MSYEGHEEYICQNGHYWFKYESFDFEPGACTCGVCKTQAVYVCRVDETNGFKEEGYPPSWPGQKEEIGFDDEWKTDHYSNKYAIKHMKYEPINGKDLNKWHYIVPS